LGAFRSRAATVSDAALRANLEVYEHFDEQSYVNGSPHLRHSSIGARYAALIDRAISRTHRNRADISVLDLGAGNGMASIPWFKRGVRVTAVDSSKSMIRQLTRRAEAYGARPRTMVADVFDYLQSTDEKFDIVTHVSMLHHIPDYMQLIDLAAVHVRPGGSIVTFQDPLRYDTMPRSHHLMDRACYFIWRLGQGNYRQGLKTRWRRLRHQYDPTEAADFDEFHVVRNGVDAHAIIGRLERDFAEVDLVAYWSTFSRPLQWLGERTNLTSCFGIVASGHKAA
jgi:SAM-dependent methyltransferase